MPSGWLVLFYIIKSMLFPHYMDHVRSYDRVNRVKSISLKRNVIILDVSHLYQPSKNLDTWDG